MCKAAGGVFLQKLNNQIIVVRRWLEKNGGAIFGKTGSP